MTDPLLLTKIDEIEIAYEPQYGSKASVPDWLIVNLLNASDSSFPLSPSLVTATDIRTILIRNSDYAKIELQAVSAVELDDKLLALTALSVVNLITTIDFTDPQVLIDFTSNINKLVVDGIVTPQSVIEINALINQQQSWAQYHEISVTSQIIAEARK
jgi:hypothetical protein